jgi:hypothetical protein
LSNENFKDGIVIVSLSAFTITSIAVYFGLSNEVDLNEKIKNAGSFITAAGFIMGLVIYRRNSLWRHDDRIKDESKFYLEEATAGYKKACELLSDKNNNREKWIMAARAIGEADKLSMLISYPPHKDALEIRKISFRNELYESLTILDEENNTRVSLPPQFFFGVPNWKDLSTIEAARLSTSCAVVWHGGIYENAPSQRQLYLSPASIHVVFGFIKFPEKYDDPLDRYRNLKSSNIGDAIGSGEGAMNYLDFMNDHFVGLGMCYSKNDDSARLAERERVYGSEKVSC